MSENILTASSSACAVGNFKDMGWCFALECTSCAELYSTVARMCEDEAFGAPILVDITAVDFYARAARFQLVYNFLSLAKNMRFVLYCNIEDKAVAPSIVGIVPAALWFEREVYDMYGIEFSSEDSNKRILMEADFEGYPLRKDFPMTGYVEVRYDSAEQQVVREPVNLQQDYRKFETLSPWEGCGQQVPESKDKA